MTDLETGIAIIKRFEGCEKRLPDGRFAAYVCPAGKDTIGWGSTGADIQIGLVWTQAQCDARLAADVTRARFRTIALYPKQLLACQRGALISFEYNTGALAGSTLLKKLLADDVPGAADEFMRWNKAHVNGVLQPLGGLTRRRAFERAVFMGDIEA